MSGNLLKHHVLFLKRNSYLSWKLIFVSMDFFLFIMVPEHVSLAFVGKASTISATNVYLAYLKHFGGL